MLGNPVVGNVVGAGSEGVDGVEMKRQKHAGGRVGGVVGIGLLERGTRIGEAAHSLVAAKVVIERAVFLDEDDDVFNVSQLGAGGSGSGNARNDAPVSYTHLRA